MRKTAGVLFMLTMLGGCASTSQQGQPSGGPSCLGHGGGAPPVPHVQGPWGTPVQMAYPYAASPPNSHQAYAMMNASMPLNAMQLHGMSNASNYGVRQASASSYTGAGSGVVPAQYTGGRARGLPNALMAPGGQMLSPPGMPAAPGMKSPVQQAMYGGGPPAGAVAAVGAIRGHGGLRFPTSRTQIRFVRPSGMKVFWFTQAGGGADGYSKIPIQTPGRYNFLQAAVYRLKLTNIPGHPGLEVYPTLEVVPANHHTEAFLAHSSVPLAFSQEDFQQVSSNNYVVKVIYLPNPQNQDLAFAAPGEIVSTQLEPGADPIKEAQRRGSILLVIRMGNMDQEAPNTPPINGRTAAPQGYPPAGMLPPGQMIPYGIAPRMPMMAPPMLGRPAPGAGNNAPSANTARQQPQQGQMPYPPFRPGYPGMPTMQMPQTQGQPQARPPVRGFPQGAVPGGNPLPVPPQTKVPVSRMNGNGNIQLTSGQQFQQPPAPSQRPQSNTGFRFPILSGFGRTAPSNNGSNCST